MLTKKIINFILFSIFLFLSTNAYCATKYARTIGGNWSADATWSTSSGGAADTTVPTSSDDVKLDANSGTVTCDTATSSAKSLDCTGFTGSLITASSKDIQLYGDLTFVSGMTYSGVGMIQFNASANVTTAGKSIYTFYMSGNGITVTLQDDLTVGGTLYVMRGTFNTNNKNITTQFFNSSGSLTRTINLGSSNITVNGSGTAWECLTSTNMTLDAGTSTINFTNGSASVIANLGGIGYTYYDINCTNAADMIMGQSFTSCHNFTRTGTASVSCGLRFDAGTFKVTGTLTLAGNSSLNRLLVYGVSLGTARTITNTGASVVASNVDFRDVTFSDAVDLSAITGGSGDCGGNTNITFTSASNWYWNGSGTRNLSDYTYWYSATNGGGSQMAATLSPLPQDTLYINADSIDGTTTINQNMGRIGSLNCTACGAFTLSLKTVTVNNIYGSLILTSNVASTTPNGMIFYGRGAYNFATGGKAFVSNITVSAVGGSITLLDALNSTLSGLIISNGTFDADTYDVTIALLRITGTSTRRLDMGSGTWTITHSTATDIWDATTTTNLTFNKETANIVLTQGATNNREFRGGGLTYNNITINAGSSTTVIVKGSNTFSTFTINAPKTVKFEDSTTQTVSSFVAVGTLGNVITLDTSTGANTFTLSDSSGTNAVQYCSITRSVASGGATWNAYTSLGNVNGGSNTGWNFTGRKRMWSWD